MHSIPTSPVRSLDCKVVDPAKENDFVHYAGGVPRNRSHEFPSLASAKASNAKQEHGVVEQ